MLLVARWKRTRHNWRKAGVRANVVFRSLLRKSSPAVWLHSSFLRPLGGELFLCHEFVLCHHPLIHEALRTLSLLLWEEEAQGFIDGFAQVGVKDEAECLVTCAIIQPKHIICWGKFAVPSFRAAIFNASVAQEGVFVLGAVAECCQGCKLGQNQPFRAGNDASWLILICIDLPVLLFDSLQAGVGNVGFSVWCPIRLLPLCPIDTCPRLLPSLLLLQLQKLTGKKNGVGLELCCSGCVSKINGNKIFQPSFNVRKLHETSVIVFLRKLSSAAV